MKLASPTHSRARAGSVASLVVTGVLLVAVGVLVVTAPAGAAPRVIAVADATVACTHVSGIETFDPKLRARGTTEGLETVHLDLSLGGCSSPVLPPPVTITGQLKGALVANTGTACSTALGTSPYASVGTVTVKWKTHKARIAPISTFSPQRVKPAKTPRKVAGVNQTVKVGAAGSPRPSVVGDFTGGNGGRTSSFSLSWKRSDATCSAALHALSIVSGSLAFS
jgi:hypothetical protein